MALETKRLIGTTAGAQDFTRNVSRDAPDRSAARSIVTHVLVGVPAVSDEVILRNPCVVPGAGVEHAPERPVATVADVWAAADAMPDRYRCLVLLFGFVGVRRGEALGLECRHLNLLHGTLTVEQQQQELAGGRLVLTEPKSEAGKRTFALPPFLVKELERHLSRYAAPGPRGRVFVGERGQPVRAKTLYKHWHRARAAAGLHAGFRLHDLRHTAHTLAAGSGATTRELMHRMGHASPAAALRYQHRTQDRDAALARTLGDLFTQDRHEPSGPHQAARR